MSPPSGDPKEGSPPLADSARSARGAMDDCAGSDPDVGLTGSPARRWSAADGIHIDVRGLAPPEPLAAIVRLIESIGDGAPPVIVHHERDPVMLYGELAERGWSVERIDAPPGEVRLKLERAR
jgi:hypothetical protein